MSSEEWEAKCLELEVELEELKESSRLYEEELQQEMDCLTQKEKQLQYELEKSREMYNQAREELNHSHKEETRKMFQLAQEKETSEEKGNQLLAALRLMESKTEVFENRDRISREELLICQSRLEESLEENEFLKVEIEDLETFISNLQKQAVVLKEELTSLQLLKLSNKRASMSATLELRSAIERVGQLEQEKQELKDSIENLRANEAIRAKLQEERLRAEMAKHSNEERITAQLQFEQQEKKILRDEVEQLRLQLANAQSTAAKNISTLEQRLNALAKGNALLQEDAARGKSLRRGEAAAAAASVKDVSDTDSNNGDIPVVTITAASEQEFEDKQQVASTRVDQIEQQLLNRAEAAKIRRTLDRQKSAKPPSDPLPADAPFDVRFAQEKQHRAERRATLENYQNDKQLVLKNEPRHLPPPKPFTLVRDFSTRLRESRTDSSSPGSSTVSRSPRSSPGSPSDSVARTDTRSPRRRLSQEENVRDAKEAKLTVDNEKPPIFIHQRFATSAADAPHATLSSNPSTALMRLKELASIPTRPFRGHSLDETPVTLHHMRSTAGSQTLHLPSRPPPATPQTEGKRSRTASSAQVIPPIRQPPTKPT